MRRTTSSIVGLLLTALALAGCTGGPAEPTPSSTGAGAQSAADLEALRLEYGLPDCPETDPAAEAVEQGLPSTALPCLGSERVVNLAGLERRPTVVNFWAQWCEPCRREAPILRAAAAEHPDVAFIGINFDDNLPERAIEFAGLAEWFYPHIQDLDSTLKRIGVPGLPATFFVDGDGVIVFRHPGVITSPEQLDDLMLDHLGVA